MMTLAAGIAYGQGTFTYDQQSSTDESAPAIASGVRIQTAAPYGQSFKPALTAVDFIRLKLKDNDSTTGAGATLVIQLHADSIFGTVVGTTAPVTLPNGFAGTVSFLFGTTVPLVAGSDYVFEPVVQSGEPWNADAREYNYPGGTAFYQGLALPGSDLWFREGIIVPEPSSLALALSGLACFAVLIRRSRKR